MRSRIILKPAIAGVLALALGGCLVSETPVLDLKSGRANPLKDGDYVACSIEDNSEDSDCQAMAVKYQDDRSYHFLAEDEEPSVLRFRRVGRGGYAVQSREGENEFAYYYGAGDSKRMTLTMMICEELPDDLRSRLIDRGDLEADGDDYSVCTVKSVRGLTDAAKAYHRGQVDSDEMIMMEIKPALEE